MKPRVACRSRLRAYTRREWLVGSGVALALLGLAAVESRRSTAPVCGAGCSLCGTEISLMEAAARSNAVPLRLAPPAFPTNPPSAPTP